MAEWVRLPPPIPNDAACPRDVWWRRPTATRCGAHDLSDLCMAHPQEFVVGFVGDAHAVHPPPRRGRRAWSTRSSATALNVHLQDYGCGHHSERVRALRAWFFRHGAHLPPPWRHSPAQPARHRLEPSLLASSASPSIRAAHDPATLPSSAVPLLTLLSGQDEIHHPHERPGGCPAGFGAFRPWRGAVLPLARGCRERPAEVRQHI